MAALMLFLSPHLQTSSQNHIDISVLPGTMLPFDNKQTLFSPYLSFYSFTFLSSPSNPLSSVNSLSIVVITMSPYFKYP